MPFPQTAQLAEPAAAAVPPAHGVQPAALVVLGLVTVPAYPAAQVVQAATEALPACMPVVVMPGGQDVQAMAPAAA